VFIPVAVPVPVTAPASQPATPPQTSPLSIARDPQVEVAGGSRVASATPIGETPARAVPAAQRVTSLGEPGRRAPRMPKWEIEGFGSGAFTNAVTGGTGSLPAAGDSFMTTSGMQSRRVSSWFFGDGARLLNDVNAALAMSEQITPLDAVLNAAAMDRQFGGGGGIRVSRALTSRFSAEFAFDSSRVRVGLAGAAADGIEATRASFISTWNGLASAGQFENTAVTSSSAVQASNGRQYVTTGAINVSLARNAKVIPYATAGAGVAINSGATVTATLTGDYQFLLGGTTPVHERDSVTVKYGVDRRSFVGVLGGGVKYALSSRIGVRVDGRAYLGPNNSSTTLDTNPAVIKQAPIGSGASLTDPGLQFSNDPSIGIRSNLSSTVTGFRTFTGAGTQRQVRITVGVFWKF
jgi:hypothetical protein